MPKKSKKSSKTSAEIKLKKVDWHGLDHDKVKTSFEGDLSFVNYMNIDNTPAAVYHAKKPNREKGHKEFMLLFSKYNPMTEKSQMFVSGMEREDIEKHAMIDGIVCMECMTALVSLTGHHFHGCGCSNETFIDGGKNYIRCGGKSMAMIVNAKINLMTDEIILDKKTKTR